MEEKADKQKEIKKQDKEDFGPEIDEGVEVEGLDACHSGKCAV
jgi:hypothetical protein